MRIGVIVRGTPERRCDRLKRNLSLESGTNIKLPVYGLFVKDLLLRCTNKSQGTFYYCYLFLLFSIKNHNFII